jgi:hypothetical protein
MKPWPSLRNISHIEERLLFILLQSTPTTSDAAWSARWHCIVIEVVKSERQNEGGGR